MSASKTQPRRKPRKGASILSDPALRAFVNSPPEKREDIPDGTVPGLSIRVTTNGKVTWSLRVRVAGDGGRSKRGHAVKGDQYRITLGTYPAVTIKGARAKATAMIAHAEAGKNPVSEVEDQAIARDDTVANLVTDFVEHYAKPNLRSWRNGDWTLKRHIVTAWGNKLVDSITRRDATLLLADVAKGSVDSKKNEPVTKAGAAAEVRKWGSRLFSWAVETGRAKASPFDGVKNVLKLASRDRHLDIYEARAVWKASSKLDTPWRELIQMLMLTGCRLREIAHARWPWIDIANVLAAQHIRARLAARKDRRQSCKRREAARRDTASAAT